MQYFFLYNSSTFFNVVNWRTFLTLEFSKEKVLQITFQETLGNLGSIIKKFKRKKKRSISLFIK